MKVIRLPLLLALLTQWMTRPLCAQDFVMDWYQIGHPGGGTAGGDFTLDGTLGQPAAGGPLTAGDFHLTGGFGVLTLLPTAGAPSLAVTLAENGTVKIFWPVPPAGWELRQAPDPGAAVWEPPAESVQDDGTHRFISITTPTGLRCFRLFPQGSAGSQGDYGL